MQDHDLTLVGLTEDRKRLVLVSDAGEEFTLAADARLRAALRGEHARLGQLEITMDSALRPRDIQARIRAGESPEIVAAAAQTTLDRVMTYATPVLAERAHIADRAQRASVRRAAGDGPARVLADAVAERLRTRNIDPTTVEWDSWRREDGRWTLVADYRSGERPRHAEFVFDTAGRYVVAEDDEARWLVGEQSGSHGPQPRTSGGARRPAGAGPDVELPLGEDAIELVTEPYAEPFAEPFAATADADWMATQASERPVELGSEADGPDREAEAHQEAGADQETGAHRETGTDAASGSATDDAGDEEPTIEVSASGSPLRWAGGDDPTADHDVPTSGAPVQADAVHADVEHDLEADPRGGTRGDVQTDPATHPVADPATDPTIDPSGDTAAEPRGETTPNGRRGPEQGAESSDHPDTQSAAETEPAPRRPQRKKGRASVPSWDEIMFGGGGKPE